MWQFTLNPLATGTSQNAGAEGEGEERLVLLEEAAADGLIQRLREEALDCPKASGFSRLHRAKTLSLTMSSQALNSETLYVLSQAKRRSSKSLDLGDVSIAILRSFWNHRRLYLSRLLMVAYTGNTITSEAIINNKPYHDIP